MHFVKYSKEYDYLLEKYFVDSQTPENNQSHKKLKTHLYDELNGVMAMMIANEEIIAMTSAVIVNENKVLSCKYPHRLHVRNDYKNISNRFIDNHWDPFLYSWLESRNITNVYCCVNEDNWSSFLWAALRHSRRTKTIDRVNNLGQQILTQRWFIYKNLVNEMHTWQYILYSSQNDNWFYPHREEKEISHKAVDMLNRKFQFVPDYGWLI
jgi:hypothetical protein